MNDDQKNRLLRKLAFDVTTPSRQLADEIGSTTEEVQQFRKNTRLRKVRFKDLVRTEQMQGVAKVEFKTTLRVLEDVLPKLPESLQDRLKRRTQYKCVGTWSNLEADIETKAKTQTKTIFDLESTDRLLEFAPELEPIIQKATVKIKEINQ